MFYRYHYPIPFHGTWVFHGIPIQYQVQSCPSGSSGFSIYCGWKKPCITLDDWNPIDNGINHLSTGTGFRNQPPYVPLNISSHPPIVISQAPSQQVGNIPEPGWLRCAGRMDQAGSIWTWHVLIRNPEGMWRIAKNPQSNLAEKSTFRWFPIQTPLSFYCHDWLGEGYFPYFFQHVFLLMSSSVRVSTSESFPFFRPAWLIAMSDILRNSDSKMGTFH